MIKEITLNEKECNYNGYRVISTHLCKMPDESTLSKLLSYLNQKILDKTLNAKMIVFIIFDLESNLTYEYQIMQHYTKKIIHDGMLSKENDIMPKIEKRYCDINNQEKQIETIIKKLSESKYTIATMESCTGGSLAGTITNVSGASDILHESYVTYCNEAKIKFGVSKQIIEKYTVYSLETAKAMANAVKNTANSDIGVGITGQLGRIDPRNIGVENNKAWYTIKSSEKEFSAEIILNIGDAPREKKKEIIINEIIEDLYCW